jgi:hypothetical protein
LLAAVTLLLQPCAVAHPISQSQSLATIYGSQSLHLPLRGSPLLGPENIAFDGDDTGPYSGASDGRVLGMRSSTIKNFDWTLQSHPHLAIQLQSNVNHALGPAQLSIGLFAMAAAHAAGALRGARGWKEQSTRMFVTW